MGGISTTTGIFSGIDSGALIEQLLQAESRPRFTFQRRIIELQSTQAAYLDINSRLSALAASAAKFRTNNSFEQMQAASTDDEVIGATATVGAQAGSYSFFVDRLVTTQQQLSRGFADRDTSAFGASSFTFESAEARLDRDISLSELNGGTGIDRGTFTITQDSNTATIDLSRASTINDVLDALNDSGLDLSASAADGSISITSSGSAFTIAESKDGTTAASLGLTGVDGTITTDGSQVLSLSLTTSLDSLNDGAGVFVDNTDAGDGAYDFRIALDNAGTVTNVDINLGEILDLDPDPDVDDEAPEIVEKAVTTVGGVIDRVNTALSDAGYSNVSLGLDANGTSLVWTNTSGETLTVEEEDSTTARDLGLLVTADASASITGDRVFGALSSKLIKNLNGGNGITGSTIDITDRSGGLYSVDISSAETVQDVIDLIGAGTGGVVTADYNSIRNGLKLTDNSGGLSSLTVSGTAAEELGLATTGVTSDEFEGGSAQFRYVSEATQLSTLRSGRGIGTGEIAIRDGTGATTTISINNNLSTVGELLQQINGQLSANASGDRIQARINDTGDGIVVEEIGPDGTSPIEITDLEGSVAANLKIAGTATGTGDDNKIDGSFETVVTFEATDTLEDAVQKINDLDPGVGASIINDGTSASPFRLSFTSDNSGRDGRFILDTNGFDLDLDTLDEGDDALAFFGSSDPAKGVLLTSSTNQISGVIQGVTLDLKRASNDPVEITVTENTDALVSDVEEFISSFNDLTSRIDQQTAFDAETEQRGALLGDGTVINLRARLFSLIQGPPSGVGGQFQNLASIGIRVGGESQLEFDQERFREALETDRGAVEELLAARQLVAQETQQAVTDANGNVIDGAFVNIVPDGDAFAVQGIASLIEELSDRYTDSVSGILTGRDRTLNNQIEQQEQRIEDFDARLESRRLILEQQFLAMEQSIGQLQTQQASLGQIAGLG